MGVRSREIVSEIYSLPWRTGLDTTSRSAVFADLEKPSPPLLRADFGAHPQDHHELHEYVVQLHNEYLLEKSGWLREFLVFCGLLLTVFAVGVAVGFGLSGAP